MVNNYVLYCSHNTYNLKCYLETDKMCIRDRSKAAYGPADLRHK